jgi:hypothetical protein
VAERCCQKNFQLSHTAATRRMSSAAITRSLGSFIPPAAKSAKFVAAVLTMMMAIQ